MNIKKIIPPIIITCILVGYFILYIAGAIHIPGPWLFRLLAVLIPLGLIGASIFVLVERIKEIRSGEEDDLSKY